MIAIHIGLRKCGSSTLQKFLTDNRKALWPHSIVYSEVGLSRNNHHRITREIRRFDGSHSEAPTLRSLVEYWRDKPQSTIVVSAEIFEEATPEGIQFLKDNLRESRTDEDIRVIMYLRDLVELMPSSYAQKIKFGKNTYHFDAFFEARIKENRVNYFETAARWAAAFGWQNLRVRALDREFLANGNLIDDFLGLLDADIECDGISRLDRTIVRNQRPDWRVLEATRALYTQNHRLPNKHPMLEAADKIRHSKVLGNLAMQAGAEIGWTEDRGRFLTRAQAERCAAICGCAVDALNQYVTAKLPVPPGLDARGFVARDFMPSADVIPRRDLTAFYDRLAELWSLNQAERPIDWAIAQKERGAELLAQGRRGRGDEAIGTLATAASAHRAALRVLTEDGTPAQWAETQSSLGETLCSLGQRSPGTESMEYLAQATAAYRSALRVRVESEVPAEWAATQTRLGNVLRLQGERCSGAEGFDFLVQAISAYRSALCVPLELRLPANWAAAQSGLGVALFALGRRTSGSHGATLLEDAVAAYRAALGMRTKAATPVLWAQAQNNLGNALVALSQRGDPALRETRLRDAGTAFADAMRVFTADREPDRHTALAVSLAQVSSLIDVSGRIQRRSG